MGNFSSLHIEKEENAMLGQRNGFVPVYASVIRCRGFLRTLILGTTGTVSAPTEALWWLLGSG